MTQAAIGLAVMPNHATLRAVMPNDEQHVENAEGRGRHGEHVSCSDGVAMVREERYRDYNDFKY